MTVCDTWLKNLTDDEIKKIISALGQELGKRYHAELALKNLCVVCKGSGDIGSEQDHEPCVTCKGTGKYRV
jgi:DnaJ-class molecular chaperone